MQCCKQQQRGERPRMLSVIRVFALLFAGVIGAAGPFAAREAEAQLTSDVDSEATLRPAILFVSRHVAKSGVNADSVLININSDITLTRSLPMIRAYPRTGSDAYLTIDGTWPHDRCGEHGTRVLRRVGPGGDPAT